MGGTSCSNGTAEPKSYTNSAASFLHYITQTLLHQALIQKAKNYDFAS